MGVKLRDKLRLDHLLTTREVAELLGMSTRWVCMQSEIGELPGFKSGERKWQFWESDIIQYLEKRQPRSYDH